MKLEDVAVLGVGMCRFGVRRDATLTELVILLPPVMGVYRRRRQPIRGSLCLCATIRNKRREKQFR